MSWFEVDRGGLKQLLEGRNPGFIVRELIQNAWDEPDVTRCDVKIEYLGRRQVELTVEDDAPEGFHDITHAYTLFANTRKRKEVTKRGRFNLGEKWVLALCREASIITTTGGVNFLRTGERRNLRTKREHGSAFRAKLSLSKVDVGAMIRAARTFIPPDGITTVVNGEELTRRRPLAVIRVGLATEFENARGEWRETERKTEIHVHDPKPDERAMIYEMGLPVVETGDRWHYDIQQRVPLNSDRDNVRPSFLRDVRAEVANAMRDELTSEDVAEKWVHDAVEDDRIGEETVKEIVTKRFGERCVVADPGDPRSREKAIAAGYEIVPAGSMSRAEWIHVRAACAVPSSSALFPTSFTDAEGVPESEWTEDMQRVVDLTKCVGRLTTNRATTCQIYRSKATCGADYQGGRVSFNLTRLGRAWFKEDNREAQLRLIIHELGHEYGGHISAEYYTGLCKIGAKLALTDPTDLEA